MSRENRHAGTPGFYDRIGDATSYELYADATSVAPGQRLRLFVSAPPASRYRIEVFRIGWYGGVGARRVACVPGCAGSRPGIVQPTPPPPDRDTGRVVAGWRATDVVGIGQHWASGYYVARVWSVKPAREPSTAQVTFVVRERGPGASAILVIAAVNTWQAYNNWGGASLYEFNSGGVRAAKVSFDRPLIGRDAFAYELPLVRFLERHPEWDVSYATDTDVDRDPRMLLRHRLVMTAGHSEYWTATERHALDRARDDGVNLAFMGANTGYWQIRYEDRRRTIVSYKNGVDPDHSVDGETILFRDLGKPECRLLGVQFDGGAQSAGDIPLDYTATAGVQPWAHGTGLAAGSVVSRVVGYEWDSLRAGCDVPRPTVLFRAANANAQAVTYVARSGARVFSSGSIEFAMGLDGGPQTTADPRLQAWMTNYVDDVLGRGGGFGGSRSPAAP